MIPDTVLTSLVRDLPVAAVLLIGVWAAAKYLDKWLSKFAMTSEAAAQERQTQIIVLLEKLVMASSETDKKLTLVVERNTAALERLSEHTLKEAQTLATLVEADRCQVDMLRDLVAANVAHYKDVFSRPCQQVPPSRQRPKTPKARDLE